MRKPTLYLPSTPFQCVCKVVPRYIAAVEAKAFTNKQENEKALAWKRLNSIELGIHNSIIRSIMKKVMRTFSWCEIVDKRFPICHVHMDGTIVEVSSFDTTRCKGRLLMEMNYMVAYGSGEASLRLSWKFGLLDILIPFQVVILVFHKTLSDWPKDTKGVDIFSLAVHNGGNLLEVINIAGMHNRSHDIRFLELLDPLDLDAKALKLRFWILLRPLEGQCYR
ncbi:putative poly(A) polymerase [Spatholobus suberectus]|nr:putative poly(A) polymerase [Spatholobus suberectus]